MVRKKLQNESSPHFSNFSDIPGYFEEFSCVVSWELSGPVLRDTARLSQRHLHIARCGVLGVSTWPIGCNTPSPFSERFPLAAILVQCPTKQVKMRAIPPLRYYLESVLRDMEWYLALGR